MHTEDGQKLVTSVGDKNLESFFPEIYAELRKLAAYYLKGERTNHTLRPTDLVHEVYLRLAQQHSLDLGNRTQFLSFASTVMRRVLVNYAVHRNRQKRGDGIEKISFDEIEHKTLISFEQNQVDLIALDEALTELNKNDKRAVKVVEMHFFGGLTFHEISDALDISLRSVMKDWQFARTWLYDRLKK